MAESALNTDLTFSTTDPDSRVSLYQRFNSFFIKRPHKIFLLTVRGKVEQNNE